MLKPIHHTHSFTSYCVGVWKQFASFHVATASIDIVITNDVVFFTPSYLHHRTFILCCIFLSEVRRSTEPSLKLACAMIRANKKATRSEISFLIITSPFLDMSSMGSIEFRPVKKNVLVFSFSL